MTIKEMLEGLLSGEWWSLYVWLGIGLVVVIIVAFTFA